MIPTDPPLKGTKLLCRKGWLQIIRNGQVSHEKFPLDGEWVARSVLNPLYCTPRWLMVDPNSSKEGGGRRPRSYFVSYLGDIDFLQLLFYLLPLKLSFFRHKCNDIPYIGYYTGSHCTGKSNFQPFSKVPEEGGRKKRNLFPFLGDVEVWCCP